jgi:hypothetical protein
VIELASSSEFNETHQSFLDQLTESIGIVLNTIEANMRTEDLLKQSQSGAAGPRAAEPAGGAAADQRGAEEKASCSPSRTSRWSARTRSRQARQALEEKAKQLALTSKYKSEFLANMSTSCARRSTRC